ncbi:MAG TPA: septum formation initiator family protein [Mycobacteriales bacterium]|nr:septum formation initiator family protein [Mycobacteriales bacterium]
MPTAGAPRGAAGRAPRGGRTTPSRARRSRAAPPGRRPPLQPTHRRKATLTARAAVLAVALASVALALALPFKVWVAQRGQISELQAQTRAAQQRIAALKAEEQQWQDPNYVRQQARERLHYVMPGETAYVVLDDRSAKRARSQHRTQTTSELTGPWYSRLWQSVQAAGKSGSDRS